MIKTQKKICDVLIVGAGPSGLLLAHELARFGILVKIIDKNLEIAQISRAIGVQIRSLEIFKSLNLYDELKKYAQIVERIQINADFLPPINLEYFFEGSLFQNAVIIEQPHTEKTIEQSLKKFDLAVERGSELLDFKVENDKVVATIKKQNNEEEEICTSFLVGADGAHSLVRKKINKKFLGESYDDVFILADAYLDEKNKNSKDFKLYIKKNKFLGMIPLVEDNHYRLVSVRRDLRDNEIPSLNEFQHLLDFLTKKQFKIEKITWSAKFFVRCLSVQNYQSGPIFLVGDAAHIHSPAGGQGMNTGLQDSFNLAFKLAMVIKKIARKEILQTYNQERKPVGDFLIKTTDKFFSIMARGSILFKFARTIILPSLLLKPLQSKVIGILSQTNIHYKNGLICSEKKYHQKKLGQTIGKRVYNYVFMSKIDKIELHDLCIGLYFSCLVFFPKNIDEEARLDARNIMKKLFYKFNDSVQVFFIHVGDRADIKKNVNDLSIEHTDFENIDEIFFMILRPDQHIFCVGDFNDISHAHTGLYKILNMESCYE